MLFRSVPLSSLKPEHDKKAVIVGGVISTMRQILTKSGSKMAFVKLEDKSGEGEVIVFPNLYEEIATILTQDTVVRVSGKISSTDRSGNSLGEPKIIADEIIVVTQEELNSYRATGLKMKALKAKKAKAGGANGKKPEKTVAQVVYIPVDDRPKTLYVHVKDPQDQDRLLKLKKSFSSYPGPSEIVLVLGPTKESAIRLPFKTNASDELQASIAELYGAECVALK